MAAISNQNIAEAIYLASKGKTPGEQSKIFSRVARLLWKRRLLAKSGDILSRLDKIIHEDEGKIIARVSSVDKLSEKTKKELAHSLSRRYGGKKVVLEEKTDGNLLGGIRIEVDDEIIDLSLASRIKKLKEHLTKD